MDGEFVGVMAVDFDISGISEFLMQSSVDSITYIVGKGCTGVVESVD